MSPVVLGLDLSLRAAGFVAVPQRWWVGGAPDWSRVAVGGAGASLAKTATELERAARLRVIRNAIVEFVKRHSTGVAVLEQYAFSSAASQAHALGELGGAVKLALLELGVQIVVVPPASARKLLGKQPRKDAKIWAQQKLYAMGAPKAWTGDQLDALVCVNWWLAENGGDAFILPQEAA